MWKGPEAGRVPGILEQQQEAHVAGAGGEREELRKQGGGGFHPKWKGRVLNRGKDLSWVLTGALWWLQRVRTPQELRGQAQASALWSR